MKLHIGQAALHGDITRYARRFDLLELRAEPKRLPRPQTLRRWVSELPEAFRFSVMLPRRVATLEPGEDYEAALQHTLDRARALSAAWLVLQTPPSVMPGARARRRLTPFVERLDGSWRIAWEPRGVWEDDEAEQLASALGVHLVRDLTRSEPPAGDVVYTRLLALGEAAELRAAAVEALADRLLGRSEAWVVIEGRGAARAATMLRELCGDADEEDTRGGDEAGDRGYGALETDPAQAEHALAGQPDPEDEELDDRA